MEVWTIVVVVLLPVFLTGVMIVMHVALAACELSSKQIAFLRESVEMQDIFFEILWGLVKIPSLKREIQAMIMAEVGALTALVLVIIGFYLSPAIDVKIALVPFCLLALAIWLNIKNRNIAKLPMKMAFYCCVVLKAMQI